jgi:hypothetical protein
MKIYRDKLYSIPDAAKRGGITEKQIIEMIEHNIIAADSVWFRFVKGEIIPGLKGKWEEYQKVAKYANKL